MCRRPLIPEPFSERGSRWDSGSEGSGTRTQHCFQFCGSKSLNHDLKSQSSHIFMLEWVGPNCPVSSVPPEESLWLTVTTSTHQWRLLDRVTYVILSTHVVFVPRFNLNLEIFLVFALRAQEKNKIALQLKNLQRLYKPKGLENYSISIDLFHQ